MRSPRFLGVAAALAGALFALHCSLDLDEHLLDKDAGSPFVPADGGGDVVDAKVDAAEPDASTTPDCATDDDCKSDNGCLAGRCDLALRRCRYDVCRPAACSASSCDRGTNTCGAAMPYKLKATQFDLAAKVACPRCAAALGHWLFVVTTTGLVAYDVSNPALATPPQVTVVGLGFVPTAVVQGASRVWLLGATIGEVPSRLQLAYIDAPTDPFASTMTAHTVLATYNRKAETTAFFPRAEDGALLVGTGAPPGAAFAEAPLVEPATLTASPFVVTASYVPTATSGTRLLMGAVVNQAASFYVVDNIGTPTPSNGAVSNLTTVGAVSTQRVFAQSTDGAIMWFSGVHQQVGINTTRAARGFLLVNGELGLVDAQLGVDIEVYSGVAANAAIFGASQASAAMLDTNTAMIATSAHENDKQTAVQFVSRAPFGIVKDAAGTAPVRQVLPVNIADVIASAGSRGIGYLIANGTAPAPPATVYVFDPACTP